MPSFIASTLKFPDARDANRDGLVAVGGDLSVDRLLLAYCAGVFPWTANPITWWSPDPRAIFELNDPDGFHVSRSLARTLRQERFSVTFDKAFDQVIASCAAPSPGRKTTWIEPAFVKAYTRLHEHGHAHSIECWLGDTLAGGVYGVAIGGLFAGESMFHRVTDASKVALYHLVQHLREKKFALFDVQMITPVTAQLGAVDIPRDLYLERLEEAVAKTCAFA